jgi:hypothetical protein
VHGCCRPLFSSSVVDVELRGGCKVWWAVVMVAVVVCERMCVCGVGVGGHVSLQAKCGVYTQRVGGVVSVCRGEEGEECRV